MARLRAPAIDVALTLVAALLVVSPGGIRAWAWAVVVAAPLLARRRAPLVTLVLVVAATAAAALLVQPRPLVAAVMVALGSLAAWRPVALSLPSALVVFLVLGPLTARGAERGDLVQTGTTLAALLVTSWAVGAYLRARRQTVAALRARADQAERDRDLVAEVAAGRERLRISRELHDVVGHALSVVIALQEGARAVMAEHPERADAALARSADVAREALADMRSFVSSAREEPRHGIEGLDRLVADSRAAGIDVVSTVTGDVAALSPQVSAGVYRIVQESLTNARKHAGAGARVEVRVTASSAGVDVRVASVAAPGALPAPSGPPDQRSGTTGLIAMGERVASLSGTLTHGWSGPRTFEVSASLPLLAPARS